MIYFWKLRVGGNLNCLATPPGGQVWWMVQEGGEDQQELGHTARRPCLVDGARGWGRPTITWPHRQEARFGGWCKRVGKTNKNLATPPGGQVWWMVQEDGEDQQELGHATRRPGLVDGARGWGRPTRTWPRHQEARFGGWCKRVGKTNKNLATPPGGQVWWMVQEDGEDQQELGHATRRPGLVDGARGWGRPTRTWPHRQEARFGGWCKRMGKTNKNLAMPPGGQVWWMVQEGGEDQQELGHTARRPGLVDGAGGWGRPTRTWPHRQEARFGGWCKRMGKTNKNLAQRHRGVDRDWLYCMCERG